MRARLSLRFDDGRVALLQQEPPWKVVRAFHAPTGERLVHLNNVSGGVLGGDELELDIDVREGVHAQVTTTGATRVYRARHGAACAVATTSIRVARGATLELLPDPIIPFAGSRFEQKTRVVLDDGATLIWWETLAPGRAAAGEELAYESLRMEAEVRAGGRPLLVDRFQLRPTERSPRSVCSLGDGTHLATLVVCKVGEGAARWRALEGELLDLAAREMADAPVRWGASTLASDGVVVRGLSTSNVPLARGLQAFWSVARVALVGAEARPLRKTY
jgi:urease accessory protein